MFQWQKWPKSNNWKKNWAALPPKKCAFQPPTNFQTKQRRFREKTSGAGAGSIYKIWNHTPSWAYDRILIFKTWFYKLLVIFESGNLFFTALLRTSASVIGRLSPVIISHIITSLPQPGWSIFVAPLQLTSLQQTNEVIDMFDFLVFNNCWCVFDSTCLWQKFLPAYLHEKSVLHTERWTLHSTFWDEWKHGHWLWIRILVFLLWFSFVPQGSEVVIVSIIN